MGIGVPQNEKWTPNHADDAGRGVQHQHHGVSFLLLRASSLLTFWAEADLWRGTNDAILAWALSNLSLLAICPPVCPPLASAPLWKCDM